MPFIVQNPKTGDTYELEDETETQTAVGKGYIPLDVRHPKTGKVFTMTNADEVTAAIKKGYLPAIEPPKAKPTTPTPAAPTSAPKTPSTWQDISTTFDPTLGLKDEAWGAIGAMFDPENVGGSFSERYAGYRDAQRRAAAEARGRSPTATAVTETISGIPSMLVPVGVGARAAKQGIDILRPVAGSSVLVGAGEAAAKSEAAPGSEEFALETIGGAAAGGVLPAAIGGAQLGAKGARGITAVVKSLPRLWQGGAMGKAQAVGQASRDLFDAFGSNTAMMQSLGLQKGATENQIKAKIFDELSAEGTSPFKKWLSGEIAIRSGNVGTGAELEELFSLGAKKRIAGRAFGPEEQQRAALVLTDSLGAMEQNMKEAVGETFKKGMVKSAKEFSDVVPFKEIKARWNNLKKTAEEFIPGEGEESILGEADQKQIMKAMRIISQGDIKGIQKVFPKVKAGNNPNSEQLFWRLQAARQLIDKYSKKINKEGFNEQAVAMQSFRDAIDDTLKLAPTKQAIDVQYSQFKKEMTPVFGKAIKMKPEGGGPSFIEPTKVQAKFAGTQQGRMFETRMDNMQKYLQESGLPFDPEIQADVFKQFGEIKSTAATRRIVEAMKRKGGPSAQAIEGLAGQNAKNVIQEIIVRPSAVIQKIDERIAQQGGKFSEQELADLAKWRSAFDTLAKQGAKGVLPSNAWALGLSFAASKLGLQYIKQELQGD